MKYKPLGLTALRVSTVCYGTWQFGGDWGGFEVTEARAAIRQALDLGINFFDTAQAYGFGESERVLGQALKGELQTRRDTIVIATKGGLRKEGGKTVRDASAGWIRQGVEQSLRNLGVDHLDLYQVHWPDPRTPFEKTAVELDKLVQAGKVRYVGVSNFDVAQMREFARSRRIDTLQPPYNLFRRDIEREILPYCDDHGIGVLAYGPLAHGLLGGNYTPQTTFAGDDWRSQSAVFRGDPFKRNVAVVHRLKHLAERHGITVPQLAVAWVLSHPAVDVAIIGARRPQQLEETAAAADVSLTPQMLSEIDQIMEDAEPIGGPTPEGMPADEAPRELETTAASSTHP